MLVPHCFMLDFLGIGAQKSGTTWLYEQLRQHPDIAFPPVKEVHFWDNQPNLPSAEALLSYRNLFTVPGKKNGEITPAYAFQPAEKIQTIHRQYPDVKLFYIIRNPIDRAWSSALMALGRAEMLPEEASDAWFRDHFRSSGSLARGDYAACLDNWLQFYPRDQLLLLQYEDIKTNPEKLLSRVAHHIGIDAKPLIANPAVGKRVFEGPKVALRPTLRTFLQELYAEPLMRLQKKYQIVYS